LVVLPVNSLFSSPWGAVIADDCEALKTLVALDREKWDAIEIDGDPRGHDCTAVYRAAGKPLAVATVARDRASLCAAAAMEAGDVAAVEAAIRGEAMASASVSASAV
jgi:hypothetical protein